MEDVIEPTFSELDVLDSMPRDTALNQDEEAFLDAVRKVNFEEVKYYLEEKRVDVNCMDAHGESALQIAIATESSDIIKLLTQSGADIGNALLQAVACESVQTVTSLLKYYENDGSTLLRCDSRLSQSNRYTTPLMMAAQNESYEIVKLLLSHNHKIHEDSLDKRLGERELGRIGTALLRLDKYRALASPSYLSLSYLMDESAPSPEEDLDKTKDPMVRAFKLNRKLEELSESEYEFKQRYKELSNQCEEYAVSLLDECRSMEEIKCLMNIPGLDQLDRVEVRGSKKKLSVLNFAIANKNEKFVAHPYSQLLLNSVLYEQHAGWENYNALMKLLFAFLFSLLLPIWTIVYILAPNSTLGKLLASPLLKFLSHAGAVCWFLFLLVLSSIRDKFTETLAVHPLDILLAVWIAGLFFQEIKEAYRQGKERYLAQYWNIVSLLVVVFFLIAGIFWIVGFVMTKGGALSKIVEQTFGKTSKENGYQFFLVSNGFFSVAFVGSFIHGSNFFQVNSVLGPLQLSLVNMMRDIVKFLFLFALVFLSFAWAERKVYSTYVGILLELKEHQGKNVTEHKFARIGGTMRFLFWDLFGMAELEDLETEANFPWTNISGEVILALYNIAAIVIFLNMLIAMMANTFQRVANDADIQWKFSRTRMWMEYVDDGNVMPPPFNLIPTPRSVVYLFRCIFPRCCQDNCVGQCCRKRDASDTQGPNSDREVLKQPEDDYATQFPVQRVDSAIHRINRCPVDKRAGMIKHLIQRYCFKAEKAKSSNLKDTQKSGEGNSETKELKSLVLQLMKKVEQLQTSTTGECCRKLDGSHTQGSNIDREVLKQVNSHAPSPRVEMLHTSAI